MPRPALLFVCLGNICRSPLAEAAFREEAARAGLDATADSAGTGDWHVGTAPDRRALAEALRHGLDISGYRARQVSPEDFRRFTHILALDRQNLADLQAIAPADATASLSLLLDHVDGRKGCSVADPYFGADEGFAETWREVHLAAQALVRALAG
ncbi:MAG: low molecular weight phosphotyrosine protein phosphatase [Novosphingobium sp.]|jgi:protein-tyrosine phosphatase|nr:low molecular weight phosphotyrosine protein phosphatase [Novosphingobium sp.]